MSGTKQVYLVISALRKWNLSGFEALKWLMGLGLVALMLTNLHEPTEPLVQKIRQDVMWLGALLSGMGMLFNALVYPSASVAKLLSRGLRIALGFLTVLWLTGAAGDEIYHSAIAHPLKAFEVAAPLVLVWATLQLSGAWSRYETQHTVNPLTQKAVAFTSPKKYVPSLRDHRTAAIHEAGHVLVYAALKIIPSKLSAIILDRPSAEGSLGSVQDGIDDVHLLVQRNFAYWGMLRDLAGEAAEVQVMDQPSLGSIADHKQWRHTARRYLACQSEGAYYPEPVNSFEQQTNNESLATLRICQQMQLAELFARNSQILVELTDLLLMRKTLTQIEIAPILARVQLPDKFPRPDNSDVERVS